MGEQIVLVSRDDLRKIIRDELTTAIEELNHSRKSEPASLLRRSDVAKFFNVSLVTVHSWINRKILTPHKIGGRIFFKKDEVLQALESRDNKHRRKS